MTRTLEIMHGYKLFEQDMRTGKLYPLFIDSKNETPIGEWIHGECIPTKGFAVRQGWHVGTIPTAYWLTGKNGKYNSKRGKNFRRVWCEVLINDSFDYTDYDNDMKTDYQTITNFDGYYHFRETANRPWIITSDIKVIRVLDEHQRQYILRQMDIDEHAIIREHVMKKWKIDIDA